LNHHDNRDHAQERNSGRQRRAADEQSRCRLTGSPHAALVMVTARSVSGRLLRRWRFG
jgi:hypothetical protein